ncbi:MULTISPECIES: reverse transcriptase domain-containing protein [unclassified Bradyrhizobium]|uniref:reverse transcriptase domain-containing protein n=1 Tax=unclassified Bradyrhizobium TaxID=2631580 RepID=UPI0028EB502B|nr:MULTISPECIES: reverse transcriptase domain-containing protein [unclassified Bradyrhizobium]
MSAIRRYDDAWLSNLEQISKRLRSGKLRFDGEEGITIPKGKGKGLRPVVMAPIANRIVRRAILEVLQGYGSDNSRKAWLGVPAVRQIMETRTSVGGIKDRGVPHGLSLIDEAVRNGKTWFVRSDIKNFFTRIPLADVNAFIAEAVPDRQFVDIFRSALATNLRNRAQLEERKHFKLFPDEDVGVAQGSALSALAANVALRSFDELMNGRGIVCVRYIDDFIMLGASRTKVGAAYNAAREHLARLGMDVYDHADEAARRAGKFDEGNVYDGTDVLGYRVSGTSRQPSAAAIQAFRKRCDVIVEQAKKQMSLAAMGQSPTNGQGYHQAMVLLHKTVRGWSQAFRHTTATQVFQSLDKEIDRRIEDLRAFAIKLTQGTTEQGRRRIMGIQLLSDTASHPLPAVAGPTQAPSFRERHNVAA